MCQCGCVVSVTASVKESPGLSVETSARSSAPTFEAVGGGAAAELATNVRRKSDEKTAARVGPMIFLRFNDQRRLVGIVGRQMAGGK
jgi:hypothetical protein